MTARLEVSIQIRLRQLLGTGCNGERCYYGSFRRIRLRDAGVQFSCGAERADYKHLALRQLSNAPNNCVGSQAPPPFQKRVKPVSKKFRTGKSELRGLRFNCQHARAKFG
jgi:hypothetical protein